MADTIFDNIATVSANRNKVSFEEILDILSKIPNIPDNQLLNLENVSRTIKETLGDTKNVELYGDLFDEWLKLKYDMETGRKNKYLESNSKFKLIAENIKREQEKAMEERNKIYQKKFWKKNFYTAMLVISVIVLLAILILYFTEPKYKNTIIWVINSLIVLMTFINIIRMFRSYMKNKSVFNSLHGYIPTYSDVCINGLLLGFGSLNLTSFMY